MFTSRLNYKPSLLVDYRLNYPETNIDTNVHCGIFCFFCWKHPSKWRLMPNTKKQTLDKQLKRFFNQDRNRWLVIQFSCLDWIVKEGFFRTTYFIGSKNSDNRYKTKTHLGKQEHLCGIKDQTGARDGLLNLSAQSFCKHANLGHHIEESKH